MFSVTEVLQKHYPDMAQKPLLFKPLSFVLRHLLHEREIKAFGDNYPHLKGLEFIEQVLEFFKFNYSTLGYEKERIPSQGKVVIIANHPIGSLDGLALLKLISEVRSDIKVIANEMLMAIDPLHNMLLPVNNMHGGTAKTHLKAIQFHLQQEGALIIFPAGEVSRLRPEGVRDTQWNQGFIKIAKLARSPILPIFIDAKNSPLFYGVSMIYKPLSTLLLVKEMFKQQRKAIPIRIGEIIPYESYSQSQLPLSEQCKLFKKHLYRIGTKKKSIFQTQKAIAWPEDRQTLRQSILNECKVLGETADKKIIYLYQYKDSSPIIREIGRLREIAFRAVGEGSNQRRDIDQYDRDYFHLILWDEMELEIVGAYRFGDAKALIEKRGYQGLYSDSLFNYDYKAMQPYFEKGLELGRSFVQPQYWGKRSLDYLWYGIGAFLKHHPEYRYTFGPVSLSNRLPDPAKDLLIAFYQLYFGSHTKLAQPKNPYVLPENLATGFNGEDYKKDFTLLKHQLSNMGVSVPTLFKQYTEICEPDGVQFLSFSVDPDFNDCIDGLILGDMTRLKDKKKQRYMGNHEI
jgi:putative hemolysin